MESNNDENNENNENNENTESKEKTSEDDFNEKELNFIKFVPYDNERIMLIYGCIDFNAYAFLNYTEPVYDNERWIN